MTNYDKAFEEIQTPESTQSEGSGVVNLNNCVPGLYEFNLTSIEPIMEEKKLVKIVVKGSKGQYFIDSLYSKNKGAYIDFKLQQWKGLGAALGLVVINKTAGQVILEIAKVKPELTAKVTQQENNRQYVNIKLFPKNEEDDSLYSPLTEKVSKASIYDEDRTGDEYEGDNDES
jgi:hypothetical protein